MQKGENMFCFYVNSVFFTVHISKTLDSNGSHPQLKKIQDAKRRFRGMLGVGSV